jgi:hypothetical protein
MDAAGSALRIEGCRPGAIRAVREQKFVRER